MKKILILNGAGKKNGNTAALIKAFTEGAESAGIQLCSDSPGRRSAGSAAITRCCIPVIPISLPIMQGMT